MKKVIIFVTAMMFFVFVTSVNAIDKCGYKFEPCCGEGLDTYCMNDKLECADDFVCRVKPWVCGDYEEKCCSSGGTLFCNDGLYCDDTGKCVVKLPCGRKDEECCAGGGTSCNKGLVCSDNICSLPKPTEAIIKKPPEFVTSGSKVFQPKPPEGDYGEGTVNLWVCEFPYDGSGTCAKKKTVSAATWWYECGRLRRDDGRPLDPMSCFQDQESCKNYCTLPPAPVEEKDGGYLMYTCQPSCRGCEGQLFSDLSKCDAVWQRYVALGASCSVSCVYEDDESLRYRCPNCYVSVKNWCKEVQCKPGQTKDCLSFISVDDCVKDWWGVPFDNKCFPKSKDLTCARACDPPNIGPVSSCMTALPKPTDVITDTPVVTDTPEPTEVPTCPSCKAVGDYNCDGVVNGLDYTWWKQEFVDKLQHEGKWQASHDCSEKITSEDYSRWRYNYLN